MQQETAFQNYKNKLVSRSSKCDYTTGRKKYLRDITTTKFSMQKVCESLAVVILAKNKILTHAAKNIKSLKKRKKEAKKESKKSEKEVTRFSHFVTPTGRLSRLLRENLFP